MQNILVELERKDKRIQELNTALLDSIPVQKVKDKIEKIFTVLYENYENDYEDIQDVISEIHIKLKKELLEENSNDK